MVRVVQAKNVDSNTVLDMNGRGVVLGAVCRLGRTNVPAADMGGFTVIGHEEKHGDGREEILSFTVTIDFNHYQQPGG